jgi:hypothetical protein
MSGACGNPYWFELNFLGLLTLFFVSLVAYSHPFSLRLACPSEQVPCKQLCANQLWFRLPHHPRVIAT